MSATWTFWVCTRMCECDPSRQPIVEVFASQTSIKGMGIGTGSIPEGYEFKLDGLRSQSRDRYSI